MNKNIVYPYIPNTAPKTKAALMKAVNAKSEREIFDMIPDHLMAKDIKLPEPILDEYSIKRHMEEILSKNANLNTHLCFIGAGCAPHYVPSVVHEIIGRGEILTAYASNHGDSGKTQMMFEYQSMMAELINMDAMAFPQYDGGTAAGHAIRMACRITGRKKVLVPNSMSPIIKGIVANYLSGIDNFCELVTVDYNAKTGLLDLADLKVKLNDEIAAVFIENPTFLGIVETQAEEIGKLAKKTGAEYIIYADPISCGVIEAPGTLGATIACGDIHSIGLDMHAGCGVAGYVMVKDDRKYTEQLKDVMIGASPTTKEGEISFNWHAAVERTSYALRENASEFTGTNAGLWAIAAGVYLALMGPKGMEEVGISIMQKSKYAALKLAELPGVKVKFTGTAFKEFVVDYSGTGKTVKEINKKSLENKIFSGYDLSKVMPELGQCALICVTEIHTKADIDKLVDAVKSAI